MKEYALLLRLEGITAHFRDPRFNTAKIGLPARSLVAPPPCTIHGLVCAAAGRWVEPASLILGWRTDFASVGIDFGRNQLPQRKEFNHALGLQRTSPSPIEREFLAFPTLSILAVSESLDPQWFRAPANPLSLGRSEDLVIDSEYQTVEIQRCSEGTLLHQCLPMSLGTGTVYAAPLYFETQRRAVGMAPKVDVATRQEVKLHDSKTSLAIVPDTAETFYLWNFDHATG